MNADTDVVYLVAWADGLSGFDTHEAIERAYLTLAEAETEVKRIADAVKASGKIGIYNRGLTIIELPLGGHVTVHKGTYLYPFVNSILNDEDAVPCAYCGEMTVEAHNHA